ncbi:hypothetical protein ACFLZC_02895 [Patescibacteria group bacterium]
MKKTITHLFVTVAVLGLTMAGSAFAGKFRGHYEYGGKDFTSPEKVEWTHKLQMFKNSEMTPEEMCEKKKEMMAEFGKLFDFDCSTAGDFHKKWEGKEGMEGKEGHMKFMMKFHK